MKRFMLIFACLLFVAGSAMAQSTRKVTGTVISAKTGEALEGAQVFVPGTSHGTITNAKGAFTISNLPSKYKTLTVSYFGMATKTVAVAPVINVKMEENKQVLDEAIVVAYGTEKKAAFTGSAAAVKSEDITSHVTSNAVNAVVGKVAGVQATSASGAPGSAPSIRVRGITSISAYSTPLYIVDGAPTEAGINNINPQDIESISVLKDAAASAIYGARGANGVIIVTTKRAKKDAPAQVTFDAKWGSNSRLIPQYETIDNAGEYYETLYKALYNGHYYNGYTSSESFAFADRALFDAGNGGTGYQIYTVPDGEKLIGTNFKLNPNAKLGYVKDGYYYTPDNWYDEVFHNSFRQEYNASISGSSEKLSYYAGLGYLDDGGFISNSNYQRYTARTNVDYQLNKYLKLTTNMSFTHNDTQSPSYSSSTYGSSSNVFYIANNIAPIYPLYVRNADGSIKTENGRIVYDANQTAFTRAQFTGNAVADNAYNKRQVYQDLFHGQWAAVVTPIEGLSLTANFTADAFNGRTNYLYSPFAPTGTSVNGAATVSHSRYMSTNQQYLINYSKTFAEKHNASILLGYEQYNLTEQGLSGYNTNLFSPFIGELDNAKGTSERDLSSSTEKLMREGFFGRLQYDYDNKYFFSASLRRDASTLFAPGHRWGTFGSVGLAWQMNKESFLKDVKWIDLLKLKVSYGAQGNDNLGSYYYWADRYTTSYNEETKEYSVSMSQKGNDKLTWEKNKEWNFGVEFGFFDSRLTGSIEWYTRTTSDLLYSKEVPLSSGISVASYYTNIGSVLNNGLEIALEGAVLKNKKFEWDIDFNIATNHNEILELDPAIGPEGLKYSTQILREGGSVYNAYLYSYAGVEKSTGKAMYWKNTTDAEGNITGRTTTTVFDEADKYDCGSTLPDWFGGFGTTFKGFGFDLHIGFSYQLGGKIYDGAYQALMHNGMRAGYAMHKDLLNAWSPTNTNSNIPRLSTMDDGFQVSSQSPLDYFLTSSNYLCLNNLTLGYTLPKSIVEPLKLQNVRVYFAGENLFLLTKRKGLDPRYNFGLGSMTSGAGLASGNYASSRSVTAGISITF